MQIAPQLERIEYRNVKTHHHMIGCIECLDDGGIFGQRKICSGEEECEAFDVGFGCVDYDFLSVDDDTAW